MAKSIRCRLGSHQRLACRPRTPPHSPPLWSLIALAEEINKEYKNKIEKLKNKINKSINV